MRAEFIDNLAMAGRSSLRDFAFSARRFPIAFVPTAEKRRLGGRYYRGSLLLCAFTGYRLRVKCRNFA